MFQGRFLYNLDKPVYVERDTNINNPPFCSMHYHDYYELYFLLSGNRDYIIDDEVFNLTSDCVALIKPRHTHKTQGGVYERVLIHFEQNYFEKYFSPSAIKEIYECLEYNYIRVPSIRLANVRFLLSKMLKDYENNDLSTIHLNLAEIMLILAKCPAECKQAKYTPRFLDGRNTVILKYLNDNFKEIESIQQIADHFYMSKFHLCHYFKNNIGVSLFSYINNLKISHSLNLLKDTNKKLADIAIESGFNSIVHYCNLFKKNIGLSPTQYRKMYRTIK